MEIGVIGQGFVGNALYQKFKNYYDIKTYDLDESKCNSSKQEVLDCEIVFVCLPTPMNFDGSCHINIVENAIAEISSNNKTKIAVVKSTVPPGTTKGWNKWYGPNLSVVFNPEFLTEANAVKDYENQNRIILGGDEDVTLDLSPLFLEVFPNASIILTDSTEAEMIKYLTNNFLSVKVAFANEMYDLCSTLDIDYDSVIKYATYDERLGKSHWSVPGPDGDFGFGGHCFPKDLAAILSVTREHDTIDNVLKATQATNFSVRRNKDWEKMIGRAVIQSLDT